MKSTFRTEKTIFLKKPKNEGDSHFVRGLQFERRNKETQLWEISNIPGNLQKLENLPINCIEKFIAHQPSIEKGKGPNPGQNPGESETPDESKTNNQPSILNKKPAPVESCSIFCLPQEGFKIIPKFGYSYN